MHNFMGFELKCKNDEKRGSCINKNTICYSIEIVDSFLSNKKGIMIYFYLKSAQ